jgi:sulfate adenylyltransferase subunit 2
LGSYTLTHLQHLEQESIHVMREVVAEFRNPVMLYSVGKDSSVMLRLAQKAFHPGRFPFPLMHVDTGYKFPEMYAFRDAHVAEIGARLLVERNDEWIGKGAHPTRLGNDKCCQQLKTRGLLDALAKHGFDAAFGGARRDEEKSRAKERFFSVPRPPTSGTRRTSGPSCGACTTRRSTRARTMRVFPLSNWTELDVWQYIHQESIPIVPLYFAGARRWSGSAASWSMTSTRPWSTRTSKLGAARRGRGPLPHPRLLSRCTGAIESDADTVEDHRGDAGRRRDAASGRGA